MTQNNDWIEWKWTPEKPYPEELGTEVFVKYADGAGVDWGSLTVSFWYSKTHRNNNWHPCNGDASIVAYKLA